MLVKDGRVPSETIADLLVRGWHAVLVRATAAAATATVHEIAEVVRA